MKSLLPTSATALVLLAAAAPSAHAYPTRQYGGAGCAFATVSTEPLSDGPPRYTGAMYVAIYAADSQGTPLPTASISVDCEIYVNGVLAENGMSASGTGVAATAGTYAFEAAADDVVNLCERVVIDGEEIFNCNYRYEVPQEVYDLLPDEETP